MKAASAFRVLFAPATFGQSIPHRKRQKSLGTALILFLSLSIPVFAQTISYFNEGFLRQPSALADRNYLGVYGSNITGWGPSPPAPFVLKAGDTMSGALTNNDHISVNGTVYATKFQLGYTSMTWEYDTVLKKATFKQDGQQTLELNTTGLNGGVALGGLASAANSGVAVGMNSIGYNTGVGVGVNAQGYDNGAAVGNATVANNFGTAIGDTAHGADYAVAAGHNASSGSAYSIAIGSYAEMDGSKKVGICIGPGAQVGSDYGMAIGTTNGTLGSQAQVDSTAPGAVEIGSGIATVPWALHYRGVPLVDSNGIVSPASLPPGVLTNGHSVPVTFSNPVTVVGNFTVGTNVAVTANSALSRIKLEAGSANTLVVTNGRVGVGTSAPTDTFFVDGGARGSSYLLAAAGSYLGWVGRAGIYSPSATDIIMRNPADGKTSITLTLSNLLAGGTITATNGLYDSTAATNVLKGLTVHQGSMVVTGAQYFALSNGAARVLLTNGTLFASGTGSFRNSLDVTKTGISGTDTSLGLFSSDGDYIGITVNATKGNNTGQNGVFFQKQGINTFYFGSDFFANGTKDYFIYDYTWNQAPFYINNNLDVFLGYRAPTSPIMSVRQNNTVSINGSLTVLNGYATATNFYTSAVKWVDMNINYALSVSGPTAPDLVSVTNPAAGSLIKQLAFDNNDELFGQAQLPHTLAITNASFPKFYTEPHIHFDTIGTLDAAHSNVTWRIEWEWANINGGWTRGTNQATMGVTNNFTHYMLELGHITNDPPMNISAIFRCRLTRPASASEEYDSTPNSHTVILDAFDLHVPIGNQNAIGSSTDNAP